MSKITDGVLEQIKNLMNNELEKAIAEAEDIAADQCVKNGEIYSYIDGDNEDMLSVEFYGRWNMVDGNDTTSSVKKSLLDLIEELFEEHEKFHPLIISQIQSVLDKHV